MFSLLKDPEIIEIAHRGDVADLIDQYVIKTDRRLKPALLNFPHNDPNGYGLRKVAVSVHSAVDTYKPMDATGAVMNSGQQQIG